MKRHKVKSKGKCLLNGKVHTERRMGLAQRESPTFGKCQFFLKVQFSRCSCPLWPVTFLCPLWLICLRPLPWCVNAHPNQAVSRSEVFWRSKTLYGLNYALTDLKQPFCTCVVSPLIDRVFSFVLAVIIPLR